MAFVTITPERYNANSPGDEALFADIVENLNDLDAARVTNGDSHDHSGGDGATIGTDGVVQGSLKTTFGVVQNSSTTPANLILPGGEYGFYPQIRMDSTTSRAWRSHLIRDDTSYAGWTSYLTSISLVGPGGGTSFAKQRYITASPPYKLGNKQWGHFLFLLVNSNGDVISSYEAEDPPWAYNGNPHNKKDSIERIREVPHPFADYHIKDPSIDGLEIILTDLRDYDVKKWKFDNEKQGKGLLEDLSGKINPQGKIILSSELSLPDIPGFTDKVKIRKRI